MTTQDAIVYEYESGHKSRLSAITRALDLIADSGRRGLTSRELGVAMYGSDTSGKSRSGGLLTRMHKEGRLAALADRRDGHHVYVLPENVDARETWAGYRHRGHCETCSCSVS